jgi:hypothetical protein
MRIGITTSATFKSKTYVAGATKANMSGAITGDTPEAFVEALHDVNDNHAKDDIESALDYISDAKCEFVKELKYQFSNLEYLEPEIIDFCTRYDVCRDTVKVIAAGYDCVEVTSKMYLNTTLDVARKHINQHSADELAKLLATIKSQIEDDVKCIETHYHISIEYTVDIA